MQKSDDDGGGTDFLEAPEPLDEYDIPEMDNRLAVHFFSLTTLYYVCFPGFSVLGTYYGHAHLWGYYFFAYHLLNIISGNLILQGTIKAVSGSSKFQRLSEDFPPP